MLSPESVTYVTLCDRPVLASDTLRTAQPVEMLIGNVVDDTYTGILDVKVTLTFYASAPDAKTATTTPDRVLTLQDGDSLTTPRNSERVIAAF